MSPGHARRIFCNGPPHSSTDYSSHNSPSLPISGLRRCITVDRCGMKEANLLTLVILGLFLHNCRYTSLHESLAGCPCLLIHHLADHLARKGIAVERLRFFLQISLTQPSTAQELLQRMQTRLLIYLGHLTEPLEGQSFSHHCSGHQQCPGRRSELPELGADQLTHAGRDQLTRRCLREQPGPQHQPPGTILLKRRNNDLLLEQSFEGLHQVERLSAGLCIKPVGEGCQYLSK